MKHEKAQRPRFTVLVTLLLAGLVLASYGQLEEIVCGEKFLGTARQSTFAIQRVFLLHQVHSKKSV